MAITPERREEVEGFIREYDKMYQAFLNSAGSPALSTKARAGILDLCKGILEVIESQKAMLSGDLYAVAVARDPMEYLNELSNRLSRILDKEDRK